MAGIRGEDTRPELIIRHAMFLMGFRHRLGRNYRSEGHLLPGRPDLVYPRYHAVIQVNGCFWHKHGCQLFKWPSTRQEFWREKLSGNALRDRRNQEKLEAMGWRVLTVWECALKGRARRDFLEVINTAANWLQYDHGSAEIAGTGVADVRGG